MDQPADTMTLQNLILPDPAISNEISLYYRPNGPVLRPKGGNDLVFDPGGSVDFDSYMNLFNLRNWTRHCALDGLWLRLQGQGRFRLALRYVSRAGEPAAPLHEAEVTLDAGAFLDLGAALQGTPPGLLTLHLTALTPGRLTGGAFVTRIPIASPLLRLAIVITTFRRPAQLAQTAARITGFLDRTPDIGSATHLYVIDNDQSLHLPAHPRQSVIANPNLGGAGGFARGLAAAQDAGATHCLFMDDDARCEMENLIRTAAFLRLARSPAAAVAGAMISEARPWAMWENGAVFHRFCLPIAVGTDLRDAGAVTLMELAAAAPKPKGFYGGWWYFAFPLAGLRHYPFPFFVRGDDISFSLANRFDTATLTGVVSVQEDFSAKESPLTLYLDLRNHLHHHMVQTGMQLGAGALAWIAWRFLLRVLVRLHYDSAEALLMSWSDLMQGPDFFAANANMTIRRQAVHALIRSEAWQKVDPASLPPEQPTPEPSRRFSLWMKYTLNGHLIPFWTRFGARRTIPMAERGLIWPLWGVAEARFVDHAGARAYVVRHDKGRAARIIARALGLTARWFWSAPRLRQAYRDSYGPMTTRSFWQTRFLPAGAPR